MTMKGISMNELNCPFSSPISLRLCASISNTIESRPHKETDEEEKERKVREKREKKLSAPKMLELKKYSLESFDQWRELIISRVGAVVNNPKEVWRTRGIKQL